MGAVAIHEDLGGFPYLRPVDSDLGDWASLYFGQPRCVGACRHGGQRSEIRHQHGALLLAGRDSCDDLPRGVHDAVLLRLQGEIRAGIPKNAVR